MTGSINLFDLCGRVALVAGGAGYLGQAICSGLLDHGATVIVADVDGQAAQTAADELADDAQPTEQTTRRHAGDRATARALDVSDEHSVQSAIDTVRAAHGRLDILVNSTTFSTGRTLDAATADDWQRGLSVTLTGAFLISRAAGRVMREQGGGSIIHFSSMYGLVSPDPRAYDPPETINPADYGAAKAGVLQLTRYQAVQWAPHNVRVNAIVPGPFPNPDIQRDNPSFIGRLEQRVPMGRIGRAGEITGAVVFLAGDASSYVTGATLTVDGGWTAW